MTILQDIETLENIYQEKEKHILAVEDQWDQAFENWQKELISGKQMDQLQEMFRNQMSSLEEECRNLSNKLTELKQAAKAQAVIKSIEMESYVNLMWQDLQQVSDQDGFMDGQEPTINIESEIDNKKSDDDMHQFIESVETENFVDDLSQAQQQQESQHQTVEVKTVENIEQERPQLQSPEPEQLLSSDSPIKMVDIYAMQEELKWSVISEIESQIIEPVADYKLNDGTMESEQIYADSIKKFDTFRGGTKSLLYNASAIIFQESDNKIMETIMFGAQTAKKFQSNGQKYQDDMKGNPKTGVKHKTQKSVKFQIEEGKVLEAYVAHW